MRLETLAFLGGSAALLASAACGGDDANPTGGTTSGSGGSGATGGMMASTGGSTSSSSAMGGNGGVGGSSTGNYPTGPYGNEEGDTFPFVNLEGYLSTDPAALATTETWTDLYTSQDLFESGAGYALIHTSLSG